MRGERQKASHGIFELQERRKTRSKPAANRMEHKTRRCPDGRQADERTSISSLVVSSSLQTQIIFPCFSFGISSPEVTPTSVRQLSPEARQSGAVANVVEAGTV